MAKRLTQFYQKQQDETFSGPIKIGTSAQYVTLSQGSSKTLKKLSDQIGNPENLTPNIGVTEENQQDMVTVINTAYNTAQEAASKAIPDNSVNQRKLQDIVLTESYVLYPNISNEAIGITLGKIKKFLSDLLGKKLNNEGDYMTGNLIMTNASDIIFDDENFETTISEYINIE